MWVRPPPALDDESAPIHSPHLGFELIGHERGSQRHRSHHQADRNWSFPRAGSLSGPFAALHAAGCYYYYYYYNVALSRPAA